MKQTDHENIWNIKRVTPNVPMHLQLPYLGEAFSAISGDVYLKAIETRTLDMD